MSRCTRPRAAGASSGRAPAPPPQRLVDAAASDPAHQARQLLRRAERPVREQVQHLLVRAREPHGGGGVELLRGPGPARAHPFGVELRAVGAEDGASPARALPGEVVLQPGEDVGQAQAGGEHCRHVDAVAALLPDLRVGRSRQHLARIRDEHCLVVRRVPERAQGAARVLVGRRQHQREVRAVGVVHALDAAQSVAQVRGRQQRPLPQQPERAPVGECDEGVVGAAAVVVDAQRPGIRCGLGDARRHGVADRHRVEALGEQAEPLARDGRRAQQVVTAPVRVLGGGDTGRGGEPAPLRALAQLAELVRSPVREPTPAQPVEAVTQAGDGLAREGRQLGHRGERRRAEVEQRLPEALGQAVRRRRCLVSWGRAGEQRLRGRVDGVEVRAHALEHGLRQRAARLAALEEAPQRMPRDAERRGRGLAAVALDVRAQVVADGVGQSRFHDFAPCTSIVRTFCSRGISRGFTDTAPGGRGHPSATRQRPPPCK